MQTGCPRGDWLAPGQDNGLRSRHGVNLKRDARLGGGQHVACHLIAVRKPAQNGNRESLNGRIWTSVERDRWIDVRWPGPHARGHGGLGRRLRGVGLSGPCATRPHRPMPPPPHRNGRPTEQPNQLRHSPIASSAPLHRSQRDPGLIKERGQVRGAQSLHLQALVRGPQLEHNRCRKKPPTRSATPAKY